MSLKDLLQDVRFGLKMLGKSYSITMIAIFTLALGIGANSAIFSVANSILLRPLPYKNPGRLMVLWTHFQAMGLPEFWFSGPELLDVQQQIKGIEKLAAVTSGNENLTGDGEPEQIRAGYASADFFPLLGVETAQGRLFLPEEDLPNSRKVVVLQHEYWQSSFGGDPGILGRNLRLDHQQYQVIGILPPGFEFLAPDEKFGKVQVWHPIATDLAKEERGAHFLRLLARLKPGVRPEQVQAELNGLAARLEGEYPINYRSTGWGLSIVPFQKQIVQGVRTVVFVLAGAVAFVLLIACVNVANLLLARATARTREIAIRKSLGAGRLRLIRQLLTESVILSLIGGAFGLLIAVWCVRLFVALSPGTVPRLSEITVDGRVLLFTLGLSLIVGLFFGLAPALQASSSSLTETLKEGSRSGGAGTRTRFLQGVFVVSEVSLALVLLIGAALLGQSFLRMQRADPGFSAANVLTMRLNLPNAKYPHDHQRAAFFTRLVTDLQAIPGVSAAGAVSRLPMSDTHESGTIDLESRSHPSGRLSVDADTRSITPSYFKAMSIRLVKGRPFSDLDAAASQRVAIVDEALARHAWPDEDPIGKRLRLSKGEWTQVVGVVRHVKQSGLEREAREQVYFPVPQVPSRSMFVTLRSSPAVQPDSLIQAVRSKIRGIDPDQPISDLKTMQEWVNQAFGQPQFSAMLIGFLSLIALVLAAAGIYGVISYGVSQRQREMGIRIALGATADSVIGLVIGRGIKLALIGVGIGIVAALLLTRFLGGLLFEVKAADPLTFVVISLFLTAIALAASYFPARRATRIDPMIAFRYD